LGALFLFGCSSYDPMNRGTVGTSEVNYPLGPYGYTKGAVIANLQFTVKVDPDGATGSARYSDLAPKTVSLADYYNDPNVGWLVLNGAAGWCNPCRLEARDLPKVSQKWEPMGVRFVTVMIQGYDQSAQTPANMSDVDRWQGMFNLHTALGIDPNDSLHEFAAEIASFPLNMLVRTADMSIQMSTLGIDPNDPSLDPILAAYVR
jgi:thiol-disulfide isomerase/thioredoxin